MKISTLKNTLFTFFEQKLDPELFFDPANNPFVNVSINYLSSGEWKEESISSYIRLKGKPPTSTFSYESCLSIAKGLQATYLESKSNGPDCEKNEYGYCSGIILNTNCFITISVVASPEDSLHIFKTVRNQIKIICPVE